MTFIHNEKIRITKDIYDMCYYGRGIDTLMGRTRKGWQLRTFIRGRGE